MQISTQALFKLCEKHIPYGEFEWASEYGEPGYSCRAEHGIIFANWNNVPKWLSNGLERHGFELEWSDEWYIEHETNKAYRTQPDSYGWRPSIIFLDNGVAISIDDIQEPGYLLDEYLEYLIYQTPFKKGFGRRYRSETFRLDLAKEGFTKFNADSYESGWHPGQNDNPEEILKNIPPNHDVIFQIDSTGQFDTYWSAWIRPTQNEKED